MGSVILGGVTGLIAAATVMFLGAGFWPAFATYAVTGFCVMVGVITSQYLFQPEQPDFAAFSTDGHRDRLAEDYSQWIDDPETREARSEETSNKRSSRAA